MFRSIHLRLIGYVVGVLALVLLAAGSAVYVVLTRELDGAVESTLRAGLPSTPNDVGFQIGSPPPVPGGTPGLDAAPPPGLGVQIIATPGAPGAADPVQTAGGVAIFRAIGPSQRPDNVFTSQRWRGSVSIVHGAVPAGLPDLEAFAATRLGHDDERTVRIGGTRYRLLTRALPDPLGDTPLLLQSGTSLATRDAEERSLLLALAGGGLLGVVLVSAGGLFLTNRALQPLQLAFERQRRFIADASHELRTPLTLVQLEAEELAGRLGAGGEAQPLLIQIGRAARLVESLMTLARLDQSALPVDPEPVHVATLLETVATAARRLAAPGVGVAVDAGMNCWLLADRDRLYQVLLILIDNACRVTPAGGRIRLSATGDGGQVTIAVADSGPGIPAEHLARIFERFYRLDSARSRARGGSGLGLAIARELVLAQGGQIALDSPPGGGAVATLRLPAAAAPGVIETDRLDAGMQA